MSENKIVKNSKFIKYTLNDEDSDEYLEDERYIIEQEEKEIKEYKNMLYKAKMKLLQFVSDKSLPLCEYLKEKHIDDFIYKNKL